MKGAQIHRFGPRVAISLPGKGETIYLTEKEARAIARALNACARDVKAEPRASQSAFETVSIDISDPFKQERF